jgi:hypothetical protein
LTPIHHAIAFAGILSVVLVDPCNDSVSPLYLPEFTVQPPQSNDDDRHHNQQHPSRAGAGDDLKDEGKRRKESVKG